MKDQNRFKKITPESVGRYNHYNDKFMAHFGQKQYTPPVCPPNSAHQTASTPIATSQSPQVLIIKEQNSDPWNHFNLGRIIGGLENRSASYHIPRSTTNTQHTRNARDDNNQDQQSGILAAILFFSAVMATTGLAMALSIKNVLKIQNNLMAKRKLTSNFIQIGSGSFFGFAGLKMGISLGAYYGPAMFGTAGLGSFVAGMLMMTSGIAAGLVIGKYFAKACYYVHTRGKTTKSDIFSLSPAKEKILAKLLKSKTHYQGSRPNLMLGYLINKIEIAKRNGAQQDWICTLQKFCEQLKKGNLPKELKQYFDNEWALVRNAWYLEKEQYHDPRFVNKKISKIEKDFKALAILTSNEKKLLLDLNTNPMLYPRTMPMDNFIPSAPPLEEEDFTAPTSLLLTYPKNTTNSQCLTAKMEIKQPGFPKRLQI